MAAPPCSANPTTVLRKRRALINLTWAVDQFLGADGGDLDHDVLFRPGIT
ncbi:MAG: hypothetical protein V4726_11470 [Verrucomicrobiota bacterium]